jgi:DNA gyrase subunit A
MAIRFSESDAREMGRNTKGVKGINLGSSDHLVGMVVADPDGYLLTVCEKGYGKRTPFGANTDPSTVAEGEDDSTLETAPPAAEPSDLEGEAAAGEAGEEGVVDRSAMRYRLQRRGGKGVKDVRTSERNGPVVGISAVRDGDEVMFITLQGMVTRSRVDDVRIVGRNTQGVRLMNLNDGDRIVALAKLAQENVTPTPEE